MSSTNHGGYEASNTLEVSFSKLKQEKHEIKLELQSLSYDGVSTSTITKTTLQYEWSTDKVENIKELEQKVTIGMLKVKAHYDAKKNITTVKEKLSGMEGNDIDGDDKKEETKVTLSGLVIIGIRTENGGVIVDY